MNRDQVKQFLSEAHPRQMLHLESVEEIFQNSDFQNYLKTIISQESVHQQFNSLSRKKQRDWLLTYRLKKLSLVALAFTLVCVSFIFYFWVQTPVLKPTPNAKVAHYQKLLKYQHYFQLHRSYWLSKPIAQHVVETQDFIEGAQVESLRLDKEVWYWKLKMDSWESYETLLKKLPKNSSLSQPQVLGTKKLRVTLKQVQP